MYEIFEHTADLGLRVSASSLEELFRDAAIGLFAMVVDNLDEVNPVQAVEFQVDGSERDYLLFDWLNELLYRFDTEHLLFSQFEIAISTTGLTATARGEPLDPGRHRLSHEVKAITYHHLKVEQTAEGWQAELIVDI
ncbi:MAG TPA: archease [Planctomycetaceae bacterium]|nr:archease [Planctomycetaceae bacterium]